MIESDIVVMEGLEKAPLAFTHSSFSPMIVLRVLLVLEINFDFSTAILEKIYFFQLVN